MKTLLLTILIAFPTLAVLGQVTESNYQKVRKMNVLAEKKRFVLGLARADQVKLWRTHFAYALITEDLTRQQRDFLVRAVEAFEADALTDELDAEAKDLFDETLGSRVFNPGPFICEPVNLATNFTNSTNYSPISYRAAFQPAKEFVPFVLIRGKSSSFADCNCRQTGTNWGCSGYCTVSGCTPTIDGCSIFYLYPCDGTCGGNTKGD